jgi:hypothetical protein
VLFLTKAEAADMCSLSQRQFDAVIRPTIPDEFILKTKGRGEPLLFDGSAVMRNYVDYRWFENRKVKP